MNKIIEISLAEFIANYLLSSPYYMDNINSYANIFHVNGLAALYEKEHAGVYVAVTESDVKWTATVTDTKIRKENNIFVVSPDCREYLEQFRNDELFDWFKEKVKLSYERIYSDIDCMYVLK